MRSGGKAQTKQLIQQKHRIRQQQTQQLAPFDTQQFQEFMRVRWYLTTNQVLTTSDRNLSEVWLVTLLDGIVRTRTQGLTNIQRLDMNALVTASLAQLAGLNYQNYLRLLILGPRLFKFLKKELAVNPYFVVDALPTRTEFAASVARCLAHNLSQYQGMAERLTAQYYGLFWQNEQIMPAMIAELYRGQTMVATIDVSHLSVEAVSLQVVQKQLFAAIKPDMANQAALIAICSNPMFITAVHQKDADLLLASPVAIIPTDWQPTTETLLGLGHQVQAIVAASQLDTEITATSWQQFDWLLAITALNSLNNQ